MSIIPSYGGMHTILGPRALSSWLLCELCAALGEGMRMCWIDAGNRFDAYGLSRTARALGFEPRAVLSRVRLARPFNIFQLETMLLRTLPKARLGEPVVIADPLAPFCDPDLPDADARRVLPRVLEGIRELGGPRVVLAVIREAPPGRGNLLEGIVRHSSGLSLLSTEQDPWSLRPVDRTALHFQDDGALDGKLLECGG